MSNTRITPDNPDKLKTVIDSALKELGVKTDGDLDDVIQEVGKEAVEKLKQNSPVHSGKYAKGWRFKKDAKRGGAIKGIVYNEEGSLTHLLEYGHPIVRGGVVVGQAQAKPHIEQVEQWVASEFPTKLEDKLKK
jgi:Bacteriophage protein of unknown function (DUF646).